MDKPITVHGVLAAAYRGRSNERATLYHASRDEGTTAVCGGVRVDSLADAYGTPEGQGVTCPRCLKKLAKHR